MGTRQSELAIPLLGTFCTSNPVGPKTFVMPHKRICVFRPWDCCGAPLAKCFLFLFVCVVLVPVFVLVLGLVVVLGRFRAWSWA